ncbi:MAG TPA: YbaB/EbfC family nucleoid-associated protein [Clostridiales bacterium]|nr:YbaB/EbfC family nucleoid-associated protein [Clostridiales bacterium]
MSKGSRGGFPGGMGGMGGNMNQLLQQAQRMQQEAAKAQEEIAAMTAEATAGGGAVKVVINGERQIVSLAIDPGVVNADDVEMLQDLVTAAVNEAQRKFAEMSETRMSQVTGGRGMPFGL